jgi:hypothetical protein
VRNKVKWPIVHLFMSKLMQKMSVFLRTEETLKKKRRYRLSAWMEREKLRGAEFG